MAEVKHTPWEVGQHPAMPNGWIVRPVLFGSNVRILPESEGGHVVIKDERIARLIAAAPDLAQDGGFLLERLDEFVGELKDDAVARQFYGHVSPAVARFAATLSKATTHDR